MRWVGKYIPLGFRLLDLQIIASNLTLFFFEILLLFLSCPSLASLDFNQSLFFPLTTSFHRYHRGKRKKEQLESFDPKRPAHHYHHTGSVYAILHHIMNAENSDPRQFDGSGVLGSTAGFAHAKQTNGIAKAARVFGSVLSNDDNANDIDNVEPNANELLDCGIHKKKSPAMLLSSEENAANPSSSHRTSTKGGPGKVSTGSMTSVATAPNEDSNRTNTSAVSESDSLSYSPSPLIERLQLSDKTTTPRDLSFDSAKCSGKFDNTCGDEEGEDDDEVASASGAGSHSSSSSGTGGSKSYTSSSGTNGRRNLVAKTQRSITRGRGSGGSSSSSNGSLLGSGSGASVNQSINAARSAKQSHLLTRQSKMAQIRSERQNQKLDAATFHAEAERMRREALAMQRQLSAKFAKARAQREAAIKADRLNAITREVEFKASVYRDHQATNKELEDRRRRQSSQVKSTIWAERRMNTERMRLDRIEEDRAWMEERNLGSRAAREYAQGEAEKRRKSLAFRNAEGRRIREEAEQRRAEELHDESQSIQIKLAGERDADDYRRQMAEERRMSHEFRHQEAFRQREEAEQRRAEEIAAESASIQLQLAGERDADDYRRQMAEERRMSHEFRYQEAFRQREEAEQRRAEEIAAESASIQLQLAGERDADDYRRQMAEERRMSHEFRYQEAFCQREEAEQRRAEEIAAESASIQLQLAGERDADDYRRQMAEERRMSHEFRHQEAFRQREEAEQRRAEEIAAESASIQLQLAGERDADDYRRQMAEERRQSLAFRNAEVRDQGYFLATKILNEIGKSNFFSFLLPLVYLSRVDVSEKRKISAELKRLLPSRPVSSSCWLVSAMQTSIAARWTRNAAKALLSATRKVVDKGRRRNNNVSMKSLPNLRAFSSSWLVSVMLMFIAARWPPGREPRCSIGTRRGASIEWSKPIRGLMS